LILNLVREAPPERRSRWMVLRFQNSLLHHQNRIKSGLMDNSHPNSLTN
jgi:hypothetical protein